MKSLVVIKDYAEHLAAVDREFRREAEESLLGALTPILKQRFRIDHATLQIERDRCDHGC